MSDVTRILSAIEQGEPDAASELLPLVYDKLLGIAESCPFRAITFERQRSPTRPFSPRDKRDHTRSMLPLCAWFLSPSPYSSPSPTGCQRRLRLVYTGQLTAYRLLPTPYCNA
jgi:hypothetical protein